MPVAETEAATKRFYYIYLQADEIFSGRLSRRGSSRGVRNRRNAIRSDRTAIRSISYSDQTLQTTALIHDAWTFSQKRSGAAGRIAAAAETV